MRTAEPIPQWNGRWKTIGPAEDPYLLRFVILRTPWGHLYLHKFLRSDDDRDLHDHPFAYVSIPLWRGYVEEIPTRYWRKALLAGHGQCYYLGRGTERVRRWPFIPLFRPARWAHRVEVERGKPAWTLIWTARINGRKEREWGFYTATGWMSWREYCTGGAA